jgi:prophage antirepressor-like protein
MEHENGSSNRSLSEIFEYEGRGVRIVGAQDKPLFVAADVCRILGIGNASQAVARLDDDEHRLISTEGVANGRPVQAVTESGLYSLVLGSRKPEARSFKRWVTHQMLPTIRKTGAYAANLSPAEILLAQAQRLVEQERRQQREANLPRIETAVQLVGGTDSVR